jgi:hypothetical protein
MAESHVCITKTFSNKGHQSTKVIQQFHNMALKKILIVTNFGGNKNFKELRDVSVKKITV